MKSPFWKPHKSTQELVVHRPSDCKGRHCCVHNPSNHHMLDWPQNYRVDTGVTERICSHGVGHPDPDNPWPKDDPRWVHGCDGCCSPESKPVFRYALDTDMPTFPYPKISQELLDDPNFQMLAVGNPVVYIAPCLDVPADVWDAAETLHNYFTKKGQQEWQLMHVASRKVVTKLGQEKSDLFDACLAFRTALKDLDKALGDCLEVPANVLPAWYAAGLLLEDTPKP